MPDLSSIIREAAARHGLPPEVLLRIAQIESGMNPNAANPNSSARGVFQFIDSTWKQYGQGQNVMDPAANVDAGARFIRDNANTLRNRLGREPQPWELYLAHQQGAGGATNLLSDPGRRAADAVGQAAIVQNAGNRSMTSGDFANLWKAKYEGTPTPGPGKDLIASAATAGVPNPAVGAGFQPQTREDLMLGSLFGDIAQPLAKKPQAPLVERKRKSVGDELNGLGSPVRLSSNA
jgi:hypothetical protein